MSVLATGEFSEEFKSTIGVEFVTKSLPVGDVSLKAQIWDTAGQERFSTMLGTYYRKSKGAVLVYDITDQRSFEAVERWRNELLRHADQQVSLLLCGNKSDLESSRVVSKADGEAYAEQNDMIFFETSAKKNSNILECFTALMSGTSPSSRHPLTGSLSLPLALALSD